MGLQEFVWITSDRPWARHGLATAQNDRSGLRDARRRNAEIDCCVRQGTPEVRVAGRAGRDGVRDVCRAPRGGVRLHQPVLHQQLHVAAELGLLDGGLDACP